MVGNVYSGLTLDGAKIKGALEELGISDLVEEINTDGVNTRRLSGTYNNTKFLIRVYLVKGGKYTLGFASGYDRPTFNELADAVIAKCQLGGGPQYNVSAPKRSKQDFDDLCAFLIENQSTVVESGTDQNATFSRLQGPTRDRLMIKFYSSTGTLQVQGRHGQLAMLVNDFFSNVLSLDELLAKYQKTYQVNITSKEVAEELEASMAGTVQVVDEQVRKQLSSALALTKIDLPLEDFGAVAFPALRALEGIAFQTLVAHKAIKPAASAQLGEYFQQAEASYTLVPVIRGALPQTVSRFLEEAYTLWHNFRHPLFHMDGTVSTSISLTRQRANQIVQEVFSLVEKNHGCMIAS